MGTITKIFVDGNVKKGATFFYDGECYQAIEDGCGYVEMVRIEPSDILPMDSFQIETNNQSNTRQ